MAEECHQSPGGDSFFDAVHREGMPEYMWGDGLGDPGFVGHLFDHSLNGPGGHASIVVFGEMIFN